MFSREKVDFLEELPKETSLLGARVEDKDAIKFPK